MTFALRRVHRPLYRTRGEKPHERVSVTHRCRDALSVLVQLAVYTAHGLAGALDLKQGFRWSTAMGAADWGDLLVDTQQARNSRHRGGGTARAL